VNHQGRKDKKYIPKRKTGVGKGRKRCMEWAAGKNGGTVRERIRGEGPAKHHKEERWGKTTLKGHRTIAVSAA